MNREVSFIFFFFASFFNRFTVLPHLHCSSVPFPSSTSLPHTTTGLPPTTYHTIKSLTKPTTYHTTQPLTKPTTYVPYDQTPYQTYHLPYDQIPFQNPSSHHNQTHSSHVYSCLFYIPPSGTFLSPTERDSLPLSVREIFLPHRDLPTPSSHQPLSRFLPRTA